VVDVSTISNELFSPSDIGRCRELQLLLHDLRGKDLFLPEQLAARLNGLDKLDAIIGDLDPGALEMRPELELIARAKVLSRQLEAANEMVYKAIRSEIAVLGNSPAMNDWLMELAGGGDGANPCPGLSFDSLDEFVSGIFQLRGPGEASLLPSPEMTAYQPTPVRHILDLVATCNFSNDDVLVDLGSGLGHVPLLVSILTGIRTLGIEIQPGYVMSAQGTARELHISRVRFAAQDALTMDLSSGTVFYMFSPFRGSILADVLCRLHQQSLERPITICSLGPCTRIVQGQSWLSAAERADTERIAVFNSL
jgi:Histone methylation protein DOT1